MTDDRGKAKALFAHPKQRGGNDPDFGYGGSAGTFEVLGPFTPNYNPVVETYFEGLVIQNMVNGDFGIAVDDPFLESMPYPEQANFYLSFFYNTYKQYITSDGNGAVLAAATPGEAAIYATTGTATVLDSDGYATYEQGSGAADNFIYNEGYGSLEISEVGTADSALILGPGITESSVALGADSAGLYLVDGTATDDEIKVDGMLNGPTYGVQEIDFGDGSVWNRFDPADALLPLTLSANGGTYAFKTAMNLLCSAPPIRCLSFPVIPSRSMARRIRSKMVAPPAWSSAEWRMLRMAAMAE